MTDFNQQSPSMGEIILYQDLDGSTQVDVKFDKETVRLSQEQMAVLFAKSKKTINEHIVNIYREGELSKNFTIQKTRKSGNSGLSTKPTNYYNLDVIISVGYRVKSQRWTKFRIWATKRLRDYLINGYLINQEKIQTKQLQKLEWLVSLVKKNIEHKWLYTEETAWLLNVITQYTHSWILLQKYDEETLDIPSMTYASALELTYHEAKNAIQDMYATFYPKQQVSESFGIERNNEFKGIVESIYQSFDGVEIYPSIEEKAAHLLFFIIKNHPFMDGNKKIWAFLFLRFLAKNNCLYQSDGSKKIDDDTLVALTLLVATCDTNQKESIIKLILNFLRQ